MSATVYFTVRSETFRQRLLRFAGLALAAAAFALGGLAVSHGLRASASATARTEAPMRDRMHPAEARYVIECPDGIDDATLGSMRRDGVACYAVAH